MNCTARPSSPHFAATEVGGASLALVPISPFVLEPEKIRHELANLAGLLSESAERARPVFKQLNLQVTLFPIQPEGERPHLKAVATCTLDALTTEFPILRRSLEEAQLVSQFRL